MSASFNNFAEIVREMLKRGADPNVKNEVFMDKCSPGFWPILIH